MESRSAQEPLVRIGMADKYDIKDKWIFFLDISNPWPAICRERIEYIRRRMMVRKLKMRPKIFLFFEVPDEKILCVKDQLFGEVKDGKKFFLDQGAMQRPGDVIHAILETHQKCVSLWEEWQEEEDEFFNDVMKTLSENARQSFTLIQGGKP